jgi:hypothetical protein
MHAKSTVSKKCEKRKNPLGTTNARGRKKERVSIFSKVKTPWGTTNARGRGRKQSGSRGEEKKKG